MRIIYLKTHNRRPVLLGPGCLTEDIYRAIPRAWCQNCGQEIFTSGTELCYRCQKEEQNERNDL